MEIEKFGKTHHHHHHPLRVHCRTKASPNLLYSFLSDACLFQVTPAKLYISSLHLVLWLPCLLLLPLGCYSVTLTVHPFVTWRVLPLFALFLLIVLKDVFNIGLLLKSIHDALFLSLHVMPSIILSVPIWALGHFLFQAFVRFQISDPYVRAGRMH